VVDPSKIIMKIKLHLLEHVVKDAEEFGPMVGAATEVFESYNGVFRPCSVHSNRLAPSRDIAFQLGDQEGLKHRLTGGWWPDGPEGEWSCAGTGVRCLLESNPVLQKLVGWTNLVPLVAGT
jgi:hypothetical protein